MVENLPSCSDEIIQPRMQWNLVQAVAKNISQEAEKAEIDPHNLVFVGGFAVFLHAKEALGNKAVNLWRGTHDIDIVVTERGGIGKILSGIQKSDKYEYIDPVQSHFNDKQTWKIQNKPHGYLADPDRSCDVDIYFLNKESRSVDFNNRKISPYPDNFITEPVVLKNITEGFTKSKTLIAVPSILDCLIMKLDVAGSSGKLRSKDENDILSLFMVAEKQGINESYIIQRAINNIEGAKKLKVITGELTNTFSGVIKCYENGNIASDRKEFLPSKDYIKRSKVRLEEWV
ncbi:MAG TPA: hypothetical protein VJ348_02150 [Candidatus Humimicrobiaceae bacterium]|nr:hypothetical protein [Candidatus Humimicrobiaceae bacterium]